MTEQWTPNWGVVTGDICEVQCDAIVNAANTVMLGGGGVDGAIHDAAGARLKKYIKKFIKPTGVDTIDPTAETRLGYGEVVITPPFNLDCKAIIHTVGPVWHGGRRGEVNTLCRCYYNALDMAKAWRFKSIAFPSISTGCFKFPLPLAVELATHCVKHWQTVNGRSLKVVFVAHDDETYEQYEAMMKFRTKGE